MTPDIESTLEMPVPITTGTTATNTGAYFEDALVGLGPVGLLRDAPGVLARMVGETLVIALMVVATLALVFLVVLGCYALVQVTP